MWTLGSRVAPCSWAVASELPAGLPAWPWRFCGLALLWCTPCIAPALKSQWFCTSTGAPSSLVKPPLVGITHAERIRPCSEFSHSYLFYFFLNHCHRRVPFFCLSSSWATGFKYSGSIMPQESRRWWMWAQDRCPACPHPSHQSQVRSVETDKQTASTGSLG